MTDPAITKEDHETIARLNREGARWLTNSTPDPSTDIDHGTDRYRRAGIPKDLCDALNEFLRSGGTQVGAAERFGLSRNCVQGHDRSATYREHPEHRDRVDGRRCAAAREAVRDGKSVRWAAEFVSRHRDTVQNHVRGECSCDHSVPPVPVPDAEMAGRDSRGRFVGVADD